MADSDSVAVEADADHHALSGNAVATDEGFGKSGAIAGQPTGQRNARSYCGCESVDEIAAVHIQSVGQHKYARQILLAQRTADCLTAAARLPGVANLASDQPQSRGIKADRCRHDFLIADIAVANLSSSAAADNVRERKHFAQFAISLSAGQHFARAEIENKRD